MDLVAAITSLHHRGLPLWECSIHFCELAILSMFDDTSSKTIYWVSVQSGQLVDLPEMGKITWREYVLTCLVSAYLVVMGALDSEQEPAPTPELSQPPPPICTEQTPEPTADRKPEPAAMKEPEMRSEPAIALEPEPLVCIHTLLPLLDVFSMARGCIFWKGDYNMTVSF